MAGKDSMVTLHDFMLSLQMQGATKSSSDTHEWQSRSFVWTLDYILAMKATAR